MFKEKPLPLVLFSCIVILVTAVMQYNQPDYSFFDGGYIIAILLTIFLNDDSYTRIFGFCGLALVLVSSFNPDSSIPAPQLFLQHLFSAVVIIMTMLLVIYQKKLYRSLDRERRQVTALFEFATEGIILTNGNGEIILGNPEAERLLGYNKNELLGKTIESLIPQRFQANHVQYRENFVENPSNRRMGQGRDLFAKKKDGSEFPVEISLSHFKHKKQNFVIAFIIDITQRKEAEIKLLQQKEQLEKVTNDVRKLNANLETKVEERTLILKEALQELERSQHELEEALNKEKELNEIKSRFVSMASHEFRTPLSTILSSSALIGRYQQTEEQPQRDKHILRVKDAVKHLNDLLEDFLSFGKLEEGKVETQISSVNIHNLVEDLEDELKPMLKDGQKIDTILVGDAHFSTDKRLIKHILINLLSNAVKFSPTGTSIRITVNNHDHTLKLVVKDSGIGIAEEDQPYLFGSFFRAKNAFNIQGTGLGLHIVKRYIDLLNGEILVESELNKGTTFTVTLPEGTIISVA
ncbi:sensor histidine kinase [Flavihumibacter profundi]|uniref:sensor histidine kinase n=1 Tax=Flavihumibacter profundi TaxID=2716883 RepID=UPI001CC55E0E|nr:PAS domain-containing sensor histidine kinase [Flavihumibacter profundi]MBZ5859514.1 PAS domain-containing sensor histidine kinase [Flavihumibacter profundi]